MTARWTLGALASACNGQLVGDANTPIDCIWTDSRQDVHDGLFIALEGPRFDGHHHLADAQQAGAVAALVRPGTNGPHGLNLIYATNPLDGLRQMAYWWRRQLTTTRVIAITGTAGKTTTKDLLASVCSPSIRVCASPRSFNNAIGVPLTVLSARQDDQLLIAEVGINEVGEMAPLADLLQPNAAIVTLIGTGHLEGLRDCNTVASEKYQLLEHVQPGGSAWVFQQTWPLPSVGISVETFGLDASADWTVESWGPGWFQLNGQRWPLGLIGRTAALNATAVIAAARWANVPETEIQQRLGSAKASPQRMQARMIRGLNIIDDTWNANPESMSASLETFAELTAAGDRRAILGDMLELGDDAANCHLNLADQMTLLHERGLLDQLILIGSHMEVLASVLADGPLGDCTDHYTQLDTQLARSIAAQFNHDDLVLIKGSRGLALERIIDAASSQAELEQQSMEQD